MNTSIEYKDSYYGKYTIYIDDEYIDFDNGWDYFPSIPIPVFEELVRAYLEYKTQQS